MTGTVRSQTPHPLPQQAFGGNPARFARGKRNKKQSMGCEDIFCMERCLKSRGTAFTRDKTFFLFKCKQFVGCLGGQIWESRTFQPLRGLTWCHSVIGKIRSRGQLDGDARRVAGLNRQAEDEESRPGIGGVKITPGIGNIDNRPRSLARVQAADT